MELVRFQEAVVLYEVLGRTFQWKLIYGPNPNITTNMEILTDAI